MANTTWMSTVRSASASTLMNSLSRFIRLSQCWGRLESSYNYQRVSNTCSCRLLSFGVTSWKPSGAEIGAASNTDVPTSHQNREGDQRGQTRSRRIKPSTSRTPWLETGRKQLIWEGYKRNHKGAIPPSKTRARCTRGPDKICGNPCPICRNKIKVHFRDADLLKQFICPHTGQILEATKTGLCRQQQKRIVAAIEKALDHGLIPFTVPRQLPEDNPGTPPWNKLDIR